MKRAYFMTVIDGVFCVGRASCVWYPDVRRVSIVTLDCSEIMGGYNTAGTVVKDRRTKKVMK